eukprot:187270_1
MSTTFLCLHIWSYLLIESLKFNSQSCDQSHFPDEANNQYIYLDSRDVNSLSQCMAACCNEEDFYCIIYQWCGDNEDDSCGPKNSCWIGDNADNTGQQTGWIGRQRPNYPTAEPSHHPTTPGEMNISETGMSGGWVFIIIFICVLTLYCVVGCIYNGKK